jgi:glucose-1-phosphate cytidylyltransferase
MKVVILAGGLGTRLSEETATRPKPMVEIGGRPILWHLMKIYAAQGFDEFVVALGYKAEMVRHYFASYHETRNDITVHLKDGRVDVHDTATDAWTVHLIDTGLATGTGGRLRRLASRIGNEPFMMTYGDGVANIDIRKLLAHHRAHGKLATVTAVRPPGRFGGLNLDGDLVTKFAEKPQIGEGWINGGFFVLEPGVLDYIEDDDVTFEQEPLERLAAEGQLVAYRHPDFWQPMDTLRDVRLLESLWQGGRAPWKLWP